jgi:hypothetical protein
LGIPSGGNIMALTPSLKVAIQEAVEQGVLNDDIMINGFETKDEEGNEVVVQGILDIDGEGVEWGLEEAIEYAGEVFKNYLRKAAI